MAKYPKEVPILTNKDFVCDASCSKHAKKHCLMEWANIVFGEDIIDDGDLDRILGSVPLRVYRTISVECNRLSKELGLAKDFHTNTYRYNIIAHNDDIFNPQQLAEVWNRSMAKLGYTEEGGGVTGK